ncbi:MAG: D-alanyl-D-alanine carboxypeptidase family protein [Patescibacteria group bacterium]
MRLFARQKRRLAGLILLGLCLGWAAARLCHQRPWPSSGYLIRPGFPRLVYVPDSQTGPRLSAASAVLLEAATSTILYAHDEHVRRAPASTTKIMTALVALEKGNLRSIVTIGAEAGATPGSSARLHAGERLTLGELLQGLMLCSGNDAAVAIAEHIGGSIGGFAALMNRRAAEFGAFDTHFRNPHGLSAIGHYTTAYDLALITRYALQHPAFARLVRTREEELSRAFEERQESIANTNRLLWSFAGADGVKTGTTSEAGHCLVASATRDGRQLVAVVLRSHDRWRDAAALLEYGFSDFRLLTLAEEGKAVTTARLAGRGGGRVALVPRRRLAVVCRRGQEAQVRTVRILPRAPLDGPLRPGMAVGRVAVFYGEAEIDAVDLLPLHTGTGPRRR